MTMQQQLPSRAAGAGRPAGRNLWRGKALRDQVFFVTLALVLLTISGLLQNGLRSTRTAWNLVRDTPESEKSYRSIALNFPRLTLGGFRGILSTYLWQQAEELKNERKWLDLETKYDMIGALQPYFVSVYTYHAWNQAYNLSAQWQDQDAKYKWVLDGMAYLYKGEQYNPGVADLYWEVAQMYFMKLGGAFERIFYREHWRDDISRLHQLNGNISKDDATQSLALVRAFVDRPYFHAEELPSPTSRGGPGEKDDRGWGVQIRDADLFAHRTDGKKAEDPMVFRWGLSPFYFAYVEQRRALGDDPESVALRAARGEHDSDLTPEQLFNERMRRAPTSIGLNVSDSRPAMALRLWCRDDLYYMGDMMRNLFLKMPEQDLRKNPELLARKFEELQDCYRNIQTVGPRALELFDKHLGVVPKNENIHRKHIMETKADMDISKAEIKFFNALVAWHNNDRKMNDDLKRQFLEADQLYQAASKTTLAWVDYMYPQTINGQSNPDRADSQNYVNALQTRREGIQKLLTLPPTEKPDLSFLDDTVVEK